MTVEIKVVRCFYKGRIYYNNDQNNTLSKPGTILQNTHACADNENNTITERTGKVKIREVETRAYHFSYQNTNKYGLQVA